MSSTQLDQVILVDPNDNVIGSMEKVAAHRGSGRLHRAISVFLFESRKRLLTQQRSSKKIVGALQWANTCCGNVRPAESYEDCAARRLQEELGISGVGLQKVVKFLYHTPCENNFSEYEMDTVFVGHYDGIVAPNPSEVAAIKWVEWDLWREEVRQGKQESSLAPWIFAMEEQGVLDQIAQTLL